MIHGASRLQLKAFTEESRGSSPWGAARPQSAETATSCGCSTPLTHREAMRNACSPPRRLGDTRRPSVMFRTDAVRAWGGCRKLVLKDFDLWLRLGEDALANLPERLITKRFACGQHRRDDAGQAAAACAQAGSSATWAAPEASGEPPPPQQPIADRADLFQQRAGWR